MTPDLIHRIGSALFGSAWQTELGRALGVSRAAIVGWSKGRYQPRARNVEAAKDLIAKRIKELQRLRKEL